jgi:pimeloyl-ACP methyl ester carboxylesterase
MKLNYKKMGSGRPLLILHGLFGSLDNWQTHGKKLAEYFEVYLVDQRNHGKSDWSNDFDYDLMAEDLRELIIDQKLEDVLLMGHSMGGKTIMRYAQKYPASISKMIVVDMGVKSYPIHHDKIIEGLKSINLDAVTSRGEAGKQLAKYIDNQSIRQFLLKNLYWIEKGKLAWKINLKVLERELPLITEALPAEESMVETLFIAGGQSNYIVESDYPVIRKSFPLSDFYVIPQAGHWIHAEAPEEFIEEVLGYFLR